VVHFIQRSALFLLLLCLGCSAQSTSPEVNRRVEKLVRSHFSVPPSVSVKVSGRKPSSEFAGYDVVSVTLSRGEKSSSHDFLMSKDGKKLMQIVALEDPMEQIDLTGRPSRGAKDAKVVIVNYDDFQCPYCARNHQTLFTDIIKTYGDRVRIVYKDYPLKEIHPWATRAANDANCLAGLNQDSYWTFADYVHANQREISGTNRPLPEQLEAVDKAAEDAGRKSNVDVPKLQACLKQQPDAALKQSLKEAEVLGVNATPTMFVNGEKLDGAVPEPLLRAALDRALREAGEPVPAPQAGNPAAAPPAAVPPTAAQKPQ
jgi:protein-disulfide isomerase